MEVENGPLEDHFPPQTGGFHFHVNSRESNVFYLATDYLLGVLNSWRHNDTAVEPLVFFTAPVLVVIRAVPGT